MKSRASIKGHPLHPLLIAFPIAFLCGALAADAVGLAAGWPSVWTTGAYLSLAGIVTGLIAGVPGLIDYFAVVPPDSSAKKRATYHMAVNVGALALFALGWAFRDATYLTPGYGTLALELAGVVLLTAGGWLGGTLVYRNQIGVDHRYAGAGKWREQEVTARPGEAVVVARADELKAGQMKLLHVGGRRIVLARTEDGYAAFDDHCTHKGGPLSDGVLSCGVVTCPWHGSQFDVRGGSVKSGPAEQPINTFRVEEVGGEVRLTVPAA
jgi:nitrite reductase/ring-hydroxylating ferredoxin subunit/uncharacterized membrane protein